MTGVRMDKWLWAARFFKTRSLSARACELGRIESNGQVAKPAREVHVGDMLQVKNEGGVFQVEVLVLSDMRGPAPIARTLYRETEESRESRLKLAEERKAAPHFEAQREGKPSKRDRRQLGRLRGRIDRLRFAIHRSPARRLVASGWRPMIASTKWSVSKEIHSWRR